MAQNPWAHGMRRWPGPPREAEACGVSSTRRPRGARQGKAGGARRARAHQGTRTEMAQVRGGAQ
jgi:hypothetical protein